ncbi:unnamed protein product [Adineta steineri]|uniref:G-protein coupled receptors family 1 profile domain-containing protein n=1 Tax=Adineta steineri TaxID=433720 RepID=A0A813WUL4_9BILA|nr:unnamed protein product [Adineta steineri]CAF1242363.1 unnamed protein product [Adineta steineri]
MSVIYIMEQIIIYGGILLVAMGVFGNGMNIFVFSSVRTYRTTPTAFYFTVEAIFNIISIAVNLIPRMVSFAFGVDLALVSVIWCKLRQVILSISMTMPIMCTCLSTIDQFFVTSPRASLRRFSEKQLAHRIVFVIFMIFILHCIPIYLLYYINPIANLCGSESVVFTVYYILFFIVIDAAIPVLIMTIFGYLAYRNIRRTVALAEQHADRQLIKMVLIQVAVVLICLIPVGSFSLVNKELTVVRVQSGAWIDALQFCFSATDCTQQFGGTINGQWSAEFNLNIIGNSQFYKVSGLNGAFIEKYNPNWTVNTMSSITVLYKKV